MRIVLTTVAALLGLCFPVSAGAAMPAGVPGAWCDWEVPSVCYSHEDGDDYTFTQSNPAEVWYVYVRDTTGVRLFTSTGCASVHDSWIAASGAGSCTRMRGWYQYHHFARRHQYQATYAWLKSYYITFIASDGVVMDASTKIRPDVQVYEPFNRPDCSQASPLVTTDSDGRLIPKPDAPADYVSFCYPSYVAPTTETTTEPATETTEEADPVPVAPTAALSCRSMLVPRRGVVRVTARHATCGVAQGLLRAYLRTGRARAGWNCISITFRAVARAKCVRTGRAGSEIVGTWRR